MARDIVSTGVAGFSDGDVLEVTESNGPSNGLQYPIRGFRFTANFGDELGTASFKSVEGFSNEVEVVDYREGGFTHLTKRKLPGLVTYNDITLTKGMYSSVRLYEFFTDYMEGGNMVPVSDAVITVYDNKAMKVAEWHVLNAWPSRYEATGLNADSSEILIETLVMVNEGVYRSL